MIIIKSGILSYRTRASISNIFVLCILFTHFLKSKNVFSRGFFLKILGLCMGSNVWFKSKLWWRAYGSYFLFNFSDKLHTKKRCKIKHQKCILHLCMMYVCMRAKKSEAKSMMVNCSTLTEITWCLDQFVHTIFRLRHYELNSFLNWRTCLLSYFTFLQYMYNVVCQWWKVQNSPETQSRCILPGNSCGGFCRLHRQ